MAALGLALLAASVPSETHRRGLELYKQKRYPEAVAVLEQAVKTETPGTEEYTESVLAIGQSYFVMAQLVKAIPWLEKLPGSTEANYMLGYAYLQTRQKSESEAAFARLFGVAPHSAAGHLVAGQMLMKKDFTAEATEELEQAVKLDPKLPEAHFLLAELALLHGSVDQAIEYLQSELALNPNFSNAWYRLGDAYTRKLKWDLAIPNLQRAVWLNPTYSGPYILLGKCYFKQGNLENAEGILRRALALDPENRSANYLFSQTLMAAGKKDEAKAVLEKLKTLPER